MGQFGLIGLVIGHLFQHQLITAKRTSHPTHPGKKHLVWLNHQTDLQPIFGVQFTRGQHIAGGVDNLQAGGKHSALGIDAGDQPPFLSGLDTDQVDIPGNLNGAVKSPDGVIGCDDLGTRNQPGHFVGHRRNHITLGPIAKGTETQKHFASGDVGEFP